MGAHFSAAVIHYFKTESLKSPATISHKDTFMNQPEFVQIQWSESGIGYLRRKQASIWGLNLKSRD